jgi:hypothetical protein
MSRTDTPCSHSRRLPSALGGAALHYIHKTSHHITSARDRQDCMCLKLCYITLSGVRRLSALEIGYAAYEGCTLGT